MMTGFALYVHWPFCVSKCPYCDFNSHVRQNIDEDRWAQALCQELQHGAQETQGRRLTSVFFGGGTPSLMSPQTVGKILDSLAHYWTLDPQLEITLEANPNSVEAQKFQGFRTAGVNRISLGIQSLREEALKFLGRAHNQQEALKAIETARHIFNRFSFDLIYARPNQTLQEWKEELQEALSLAQGHLSLYQLTLEPGTAFYTQAHRGDWTLPTEDMAASFYELTQDLTETNGLSAYEVSNYASPGQECRHNLVYWRYEDYVAIGPGAHARLEIQGKKWALKGWRAPETWLKSVEEKGHGIETRLEIDPLEQATEYLMMGLRLTEGVSLERLAFFSTQLGAKILEKDRLRILIQEGFLEQTEGFLRATPQGRLRLNGILSYILKN